MIFSTSIERTVVALTKVAELWETRLDSNWLPPSESGFPWSQVRESLVALLPGMRTAREWVERASAGILPATSKRRTVTLILAGNTPLLAWSPLCACLLVGVETIRVKLSRDETVWTRLFVESLKEVAPELSTTIELYDFPGEDIRTYALLQDTDAVVAYGSDVAISALKTRTPEGTPFFGYGHAVSLAFVDAFTNLSGARKIATDVLMYNQQGCLSPHLLYTRLLEPVLTRIYLPTAFVEKVKEWNIAPVSDPAQAQRIRAERDLAYFQGYQVEGDEALRWTVITADVAIPYPAPVGLGILYVSGLHDTRSKKEAQTVPLLRELLRPVCNILSCVGVFGKLRSETETILREVGVSRFCPVGKMQMPPLDWSNGNRDLLAELLRLPDHERVGSA